MKSNRSQRALKRAGIACAMVALVFQLGCPGTPENDEFGSYEDTDERELYQEAQSALRTQNYSTAIDRLEVLESHFPFGSYAEQAKLDTIYAFFMQGDYASASEAATSFIDNHPQDRSVDYAYYMRGLCSYERNRGFFDRFLGAPEYTRDITNARTAFLEFSEFLEKFPNSLYAKDASLRMVYLRNSIARSELNIAMFYLTRSAYPAAIKRASGVIESFPTADVIPDALAILVESNYKLGLNDAANDSLRILKLNFPDYEGFNRAGELELDYAAQQQDRSFLSLISFNLLGREKAPPPLRVEFVPGESN